MSLRKELLLLSVISIVFLAGCATQPTAPTGTGVIIKSFAPERSDVEGATDILFLLTIQNVGEKTASNVNAELFGLSTEWVCQPSGNCVIGPWALEPADQPTGFVGEEASNEWIVRTPPAKNNDIVYDASARVSYGYTTVSDSLLRFVTSDYLRINPNAQSGVVTSKSTSGPLLVTVRAQTPVISSGSTLARVQFEIQNIGGGRVFVNNVASANLDKIHTLTITGVTACRSVPAAGGTFTSTDTIRLAGGKSTVITCDLDVSNIGNFKDKPVTLTADYGYFVESTTQVTVNKALS